MRSATGFSLVAFACVSVIVGLVRAHQQPAADPPPTPEVAVADSSSSGPLNAHAARHVIVYYFHTNTRCATCRAIEAQTTAVIDQHFAFEVDAGLLEYRIVNMDTPEGGRLRDRYGLAFGTVVVQGPGADGPWANLAEVWSLVHAEPGVFDGYLRAHIEPMLEAAG